MTNLAIFDLMGKKALVTGGAMGIGRGYALALAGAGADVAIVDINEKCGHSTTEEIKSLGRESIFVKCDVTDKDQVQNMIKAIAGKFGRLDIGVNNAGIIRYDPNETVDKEGWDAVMALNVSGVFLCAQAEAQQMIKQKPMGGKIINTASMSATIANTYAPYAASKAGVVHLTKSLAAEWGRYNINVNCISPTWVWSPQHASAPTAMRDRLRKLHPMGWIERPEDLYGPVIFLASTASDYVTGHNLMVDGGFTLNVWLVSLRRVAPPRVTREEEVLQLKHDLDVLGVEHDKEGFAPSLHPDETEYLEREFGVKP